LLACAALLGGGVLVSSSQAQVTLDKPIGEQRPYHLDSGPRGNAGGVASLVFGRVVQIDGAAWVRLYFGRVDLEPGSVVRITSLHDQETQVLDAAGLAQWGNTSAYFNGDAVLLELVGGPKTARNRLVVERVALEVGVAQPVGSCGICAGDDRLPSSQNWAGRLLPAGCSASVWHQDSCLVTAGHCVEADSVIEFEVPASNPDCSLNHPPVVDQFPIIETDFVNGGVGNDWAVMRTGTNSLGQTAYERYGQLRPIASTPGEIGQNLSVWGYGVDTECERYQVQQTSSGSLNSVQRNYYTYDVDTTFGNSGSAVIRLCVNCDPQIIAVVTHCDCPNNIGTRVDLPSFAAARAALCAPDCPTDVNGDGSINVLDLIDLLLCFGLPAVPGCEAEDVNGDGDVNVLDLIDLLLDLATACG